jgi:two-component system sensor histidine kinase YesM
VEDAEEIGEIVSQIMSLVNSNRDLEDKLETQFRLVSRTKILMMQMQINPHFLFNTFNALSVMAAESCGIDHVLTLSINRLAGILRFALEAAELVPVSEEARQAKNYIGVMQLRYAGMFSDEWNIEDGAGELLIPKFTLQPIIENAIYHGISPNGREKGLISFDIARDEQSVLIRVRDNGVGMDEDALNRLNAHIRSEELLETQHIGMWNVYQRAKLLSANQCAMEISSRPKQGTSVSIKFPRMI